MPVPSPVVPSPPLIANIRHSAINTITKKAALAVLPTNMFVPLIRQLANSGAPRPAGWSSARRGGGVLARWFSGSDKENDNNDEKAATTKDASTHQTAAMKVPGAPPSHTGRYSPDPIYAKTDFRKLMGEPLQKPAGQLWDSPDIHSTWSQQQDNDRHPHPVATDDDDNNHEFGTFRKEQYVGDRQFIPQVSLAFKEGNFEPHILMIK